MPLKYEQTFRVRGSGQFPHDMLRYDHCFPAHESESPLLKLDDAGEYREVEMKRYIETAKELPTVGRWRSFCWEVIESSVSVRRLP
jgi:hypothetical protein